MEAALDLLEGPIIPLMIMPGASGVAGAKRLMLRRFPYDVVVKERNGELLVIAFAHQSRRPGYWRDRIDT